MCEMCVALPFHAITFAFRRLVLERKWDFQLSTNEST